MVARWNGPVIVLGKNRSTRDDEDVRQSYWIAFKGSILLVAAEHLRSATREETLADAVLNRTPVEVREALDQDRGQLRFQDLRRQGEPLASGSVPANPLAGDMAEYAAAPVAARSPTHSHG